MPRERTTVRDPRTTPPRDDAAPAIDAAAATDAADALAGVLHDDPAREARFWRARAAELAAQLARAQQRLAALAAALPIDAAPLVVADATTVAREAGKHDPLAGWQETTELTPAHVATELPRLWARLGRAR